MECAGELIHLMERYSEGELTDEDIHIQADNLLVNLLLKFGCTKTVKAYSDIPAYYC